MNMLLFIFLFIIMIGIEGESLSLRSAYFRIIDKHHFEQANFCLPSVDILIVANRRECQIICIKNHLCRTITYSRITNQCNLFTETLEDGRIIPNDSSIVISLIKRYSFDEITNEYLLTQITSPTDIIVGIWNTTVGQDSSLIKLDSYDSGSSPPHQDVSKVIDNNISTKHVSFGNGCNICNSITAGQNTGFYIIPKRLSILTHLCWATSNEANETARDPMFITIEGSNETLPSNLIHGSSWSLIYNGTSGLDGNVSRATYKLIELNSLFKIQSIPFKSYRLLIVEKRGSEDSVQYSEAQFFGHIINSD